MLDDAKIRRWLSTSPELTEQRLLTSGQARKCVNCLRATDNKHLDMNGRCPDCGDSYRIMIHDMGEDGTGEGHGKNPGVSRRTIMLAGTIVLALVVIGLVNQMMRGMTN